MEMLRRNLKRQPSRSLSAFAVSSPLPADGQENLHPNLTATPPPMSPAKNSLASPRSKPVPASAAAAVPPPEAAAVEEERAVPARAPADNEPSVKVVVRVRPAVSRPVDGKDLFFVRKTSPSSVAVGDRAFAVDGFLDDRASQEDAFHLVGVPMIDSTLAGFNTSLVCYGQSGTGKTYTMWGPLAAMFDSRSNRADRGIVPRFFQHLFSQIQGKQESSPEKQTSYQCRCSFLEACVLPPPRKSSCANYARVVNNILQGLTNMQLWLRIPLEKSEPMDEDPARVNNNNNATTGTVDSWEWWNSFRLLCEHSSQLYVALDILSSLPSMNSLGRWFREPVRAAILQTNAFLTNARGYPCLSKRHQTLLSGFFNHSVQIIISRRSNHNVSQVSEGVLGSDENHTEDTLTRHALSPYLDYIAYLYQRMDPLPEQERFEINYRDFLQSPLQPLMDNLEAQTYETFEKGTVKYKQAEGLGMPLTT